MFASTAHAQTPAPAGGGAPDGMGIYQFGLLFVMAALFYFIMIRPQQKQMKAHRAMIEGVKRGDTVVLSSGVIGKITKVDETEVQVEIAPNVVVKVVKAQIRDVRTRGEPVVANDAKS